MADEKTAASVEGVAGEGRAADGAAASQFEASLRAVLEKVRPFLQMDGGDIELVAIEDKNAMVRLKGACSGCPSAIYTLKMGVEQAIRREVPEFGELIQVE
jgi:Fe-S cluster biogenesis protein NfuA